MRASENGPRRRAGSLAAALVCATALSLAFAATAAAVETEVFSYTGDEQEFEVPEGIHFVKVDLVGGTGGAAGAVSGGEAAEVASSLTVAPGTTLYIEVGGRGQSEGEGGEGGFNGGGDGGAGGGGATDIRTASRSTPLTTEDTRLVVAGGGGGAGSNGESSGTKGGNAEEAGEDAEYLGGKPGTQTEGGEGAEGCPSGGPNRTGANGERGAGGAGGDAEYSTGPGGGGGGGLFGGGGGAGACTVGSTGGGGGSSLVTSGLTSLTTSAPKVTITYNPPPTVTITSPVNEATFIRGQAVNAGYGCLPGSGTTLKTCVGTVANGAPLDTSTLGIHSITVEAEDLDKGTDSETAYYTVVAPQGPTPTGPTPPGPQPPVPVPPVTPNTILVSHPKKTIKTEKPKVKVRFGFSADVAGSTFKCKLDRGSYAPCSSPKSYKVKPGSHVFSVEAVDAAGNDPTPASFRFKVKKTG